MQRWLHKLRELEEGCWREDVWKRELNVLEKVSDL
jgi:hypothetical protein